MSLLQRQAAFKLTVEAFKGRPFGWGGRDGRADCLRLFAAHCRHMGQGVSIVAAGQYSTLIGAHRALKRTGFASLPAAIDSRFERIPPAAALIGDVLALPGEGGLHALQIAAGNGRVFGFHEDTETADFIQPRWEVGADIVAWRIPPLNEVAPGPRTLEPEFA